MPRRYRSTKLISMTIIATSATYTQMETCTWLHYIFGCLLIFQTLYLIRCFFMFKRLQELKQALDIKNNPRTPQDILKVYKNNPGHKFFTRSERRFREQQLKKRLKQSWNQNGSHTKGTGTEPEPKPKPEAETEPVKRNPALKEFSRMNRQLRQPSPPKSHSHISHLLHPHLLLLKLCIYTALSFLTFCIFCHSLRINLTESSLLEVEGESDDLELWDPV